MSDTGSLGLWSRWSPVRVRSLTLNDATSTCSRAVAPGRRSRGCNQGRSSPPGFAALLVFRRLEADIHYFEPLVPLTLGISGVGALVG